MSKLFFLMMFFSICEIFAQTPVVTPILMAKIPVGYVDQSLLNLGQEDYNNGGSYIRYEEDGSLYAFDRYNARIVRLSSQFKVEKEWVFKDLEMMKKVYKFSRAGEGFIVMRGPETGTEAIHLGFLDGKIEKWMLMDHFYDDMKFVGGSIALKGDNRGGWDQCIPFPGLNKIVSVNDFIKTNTLSTVFKNGWAVIQAKDTKTYFLTKDGIPLPYSMDSFKKIKDIYSMNFYAKSTKPFARLVSDRVNKKSAIGFGQFSGKDQKGNFYFLADGGGHCVVSPTGEVLAYYHFKSDELEIPEYIQWPGRFKHKVISNTTFNPVTGDIVLLIGYVLGGSNSDTDKQPRNHRQEIWAGNSFYLYKVPKDW